jgi:hypothetical protein
MTVISNESTGDINMESENGESADKPADRDNEEADLSISQDQILPPVELISESPIPPHPPSVENKDQAVSSPTSSQLFHDEIGKNVLNAFHNLEQNVGKLKQNLERQFNDSEEDEVDGDDGDVVELDESFRQEIESSRWGNIQHSPSTSSGGSEADMDELINTLNRHDKMMDDKSDKYKKQQNAGFFSSSSGALGLQNSSDDDVEEDEDDSTMSSSNSRGNHNFVGKIFDLINTLQQREISPDVDEWENDDDAGYITISLSEQEFVEFEEVMINMAE